MSVSDERKRSTSSATTCSLSFLSIESLTSFGPGKAGPKEMKALDSNRLGWASDPYGTASCLRRQRCCSELRRGLGALLLFRYAACALRVDGNARAHRARKRDRADVTAFRGGGLCPDDLLDNRRVVLQQLTLVEALLPDRQVDIRAPVGAVLGLACFRVTARFADVERPRPRLRVRHLPTRAEDAAEPAHRSHHVRGRDGDVEVVEPLLDPLGEVGRADKVRAGVVRLLRLLALGEHGNARVLAGAVREHERAPQLLLGMADVEAEIEVHLDGLVELDAVRGLQELDRLERRVHLLAVDGCPRMAVTLAVLGHQVRTSTPIERAVPSTIFMAWSMSRAFKSTNFVSAIWRTWSRVRRPTFSRFGSPEPFSRFSASLMSTAAGGVFVMNVNDRSSYTVISTGVMRPPACVVCALNALQ